MRIAIASGKGGTGKTTVATSLALSLARSGKAVSCIDCDVEAPNAHIFLQPTFSAQKTVNLMIPSVDASLCSGCGRCAEVCEFHAIVVLGGKTLVFPELCHGCGSCTLVCPDKAIHEVPKPMGQLASGPAADGIQFAHGLLDVGEPMAVPVISQLKTWADDPVIDVTVLDSPPGASCPVVEALRGADFVILVTEPTPFGLHDLKLAAELLQELNIPAGVIINRSGIGDNGVETYCRDAGLPVLMSIPVDRRIAETLAQGEALVTTFPEYIPQFEALFSQVMARVDASEQQGVNP